MAKRSLAISAPYIYPNRQAAEQDAERSAKTLKAANGFNPEHGYWWGRDLRGIVYRWFVEAI
jgi:hypothetical protein